MTGPGGGIGDIPIGGIPGIAPITIRSEVHSGVELYHMVDRFFGGGLTAGQLHGELEPVCDGPGKAQLEHIRHVLNSTSSYLTNHVSTELEAIEKDLFAAYQGAATNNMQTQFQKAGTMLGSTSPKFTSLASGINSTQDTLNAAWKVVKGYSRFDSDVSNLSSLNPFGGGESDDDKANDAWNAAKSSLQGIGSSMAANNPDPYTPMYSVPYTPPPRTNPAANIGNPGAPGPGPGHFNPGPGHYQPGHYNPGGPGGPGPGSPGPGYGGPGPGYGGPGPGYGGPGPGYGGPGPGYGGPGPGNGLDTGSDLAGAGPGPGPGYGGPGPGFGGGSGDASGLAGTGGPGAGGAGAGAAGAAGHGGLGAVPLGGRGGGGGGGDGERERSTWLTEDDDVWGDSDAPDGVIS